MLTTKTEKYRVMKRSMNETIPETVDEYLKPLPAKVKKSLQQLRTTIKVAAPSAEEIISYRIPTYKLNGALVHFAAFANHCSFFVVSKKIITMFEKELSDFKTSGTTIQFDPENPIPATLVTKIVKIRLRENEERVAANELISKETKKNKK
jgi:uncharacterized protein YdhG (YjbR/CyaY superfamily)